MAALPNIGSEGAAAEERRGELAPPLPMEKSPLACDIREAALPNRLGGAEDFLLGMGAEGGAAAK